MPTHDIIDNRNRVLAPEINNFLAGSIRAHFAVGCFFIDLSDENTAAVRRRCGASPNVHRVDIRFGDCNDLVEEQLSN